MIISSFEVNTVELRVRVRENSTGTSAWVLNSGPMLLARSA